MCAVDGERDRGHRRAQLHQRIPQSDSLCCSLWTGDKRHVSFFFNVITSQTRLIQPPQSGNDSVVSLQEKVLLWLLQFMQEQAISLDEVDQNGNTAVHVAAQYGHLTCIQVCDV